MPGFCCRQGTQIKDSFVKLLLDQNISYRLVGKIDPLFPGTEHVRRLGLENKLDNQIWDYAKKEGFTIVTFDSDFYDMSLLRGHPPKLIWITAGNTTTRNLEKILVERAEQLNDFVNNNELGCLEIPE